MSRRTKGPRLWLQPAREARDGRTAEAAVWVIRDGNRKRSTGFCEEQHSEAQKALAEYIIAQHSPATGRDLSPSQVSVADAISLYASEVAVNSARPHEVAAQLERLLDYFGSMTLADINGASCRAYVRERGKKTASLRELEYLRAAVRFAHKEGVVDRAVPVTLPEKPQPRERWLERDEAAALIWAAWRMRQKHKGQPTKRATAKHVARFILVALYTGTRAGAICSAAIRPTVGTGYIDLDAGLFYRRPPGEKETKKRKPPVALPDRLLVHLERWERLGISERFVVEWNGKPVNRINKAFRAVRDAAGLGDDVTPHTFRHTAATWLARNGVPFTQAADYVGMSVGTYERVYRHHSPGYQEQARNGIAAKPRPTVTRQKRKNASGT